MALETRKEMREMKKHKILLIIGIIIFAIGVGVIVWGFHAAGGEENSLIFEKKVTAQITDTRVSESTVGRKKKNGSGYSAGHKTYTYHVEFLVSDGENSYTESQIVTKSIYDEYSSLEKNKDMEFNLYRNPDGSAYLSLKELSAAAEEYRDSGRITADIAVQMIIGMVIAAVGWILLAGGLNGMKKKNAEK